MVLRQGMDGLAISGARAAWPLAVALCFLDGYSRP
jgi:hypothetical protein